jgi:hypothetical protein
MTTRFTGGERLSATKLNELSQAIEAANPFPGDTTRTPRGSHPYRNRLPNEAPKDWINRFRLEFDDQKYGVTVRIGSLARNGGAPISKAETYVTGAGNDIDGYAAAFAASTTYYVYRQLYNATATIDPSQRPSGVKIVCATTLPTDAANKNIYLPLGEFKTDSLKMIFPDSFIVYEIGDIDDICLVPDAEMVPQKANPVNKSLGYNSDNIDELEIWGFHDATDTTLDASALFPWRKSTAALNEILWCDLENLGTWLRKSVEEGGGGIDDAIDSKLSDNYWKVHSTYADNQAGHSIGDDSHNQRIDLDNSILCSGTGAGHGEFNWATFKFLNPAAGTRTWEFESSNRVKISCGDSDYNRPAENALYCGGGIYGSQVYGVSIHGWYIDCDNSVTAARFDRFADQGISIPGWISGGIVYGTSLVEKTIQVVDDTTGMEIRMKVLGIVL